MIIDGASPLFGSLKTFKPKARARLTIDTTAIIPGLNIQAKTPQPRKLAFFYFNSAKHRDEKFVIWLNAVNNSLSPHRNNYYQTSQNGRQVVKHLEPHLSRIQATVYCRKQGTPNIYSDLVRAKFPVVNIVQDISSRKNAKTPAVVNDYNQLHQKPHLEMKTLCVVLKHGEDCKKIIHAKQTSEA